MLREKSKKDLAFEQERVKLKRTIRQLESEITELKLLLSDVEFQAAKHASLNSSLIDDMFKLKEFIGLSEEQQKYILGYMQFEIELDKLRDVASLYPYQTQMHGQSLFNPSYILDDDAFDPKHWARINAVPKKYINVGLDLASGPDKSVTINIGAKSPGRKNFAQRMQEGNDE